MGRRQCYQPHLGLFLDLLVWTPLSSYGTIGQEERWTPMASCGGKRVDNVCTLKDVNLS